MIVGKEGQPRSGKSYEAVKYDILEALKADRKVYARLNGLNHEAIAAHLSMEPDKVRALLVTVADSDVLMTLVARTREDGSMEFPAIDKGALVVVDECHEYFPTGRAPLAKENEDFFAKHGHIAVDVVLMSQDFKEVHRSVVRRMQRKNVYVKLDALGKDNSYSVRMYTATLAGKFELMGSEKREYDAAIYPLYHGIQPGVEGNPVYKTGSKTLWQTARKPAIFVGVAVLLGVFALFRFFGGGGGVAPAQAKAEPPARPTPRATNAQPMAPASAVPAPVAAVVKREPEKKLPAGISYVVELQGKARPRYAGSFGERQILEFRQPSGQVIERLYSEQFIALGWTIEAMPFGVIARWEDREIIFTSWPLDLPGQQSEQTARRIAAAGSPVASASESQPIPAAGVAAVVHGGADTPQVAGYGGMMR